MAAIAPGHAHPFDCECWQCRRYRDVSRSTVEYFLHTPSGTRLRLDEASARVLYPHRFTEAADAAPQD